MKNVIYLQLVLGALLVGCTAQQIQQARKTLEDTLGEQGQGLTTAEVAKGLKEALINGTNKGSSTVSQLNGYYKNPQIKIPFPPEIQKVETKLREIGLGNQVDRFVETLNRGAEEAAKEAKPIFVNAITSMTIQDAWGILKGNDDAATQYLIRTTSSDLKTAFQPVIRKALDNTNATKYYSDVITAYNRIPLLDDVDSDLNSYATDRAIDGLFVMIAKEEKNIRMDPLARTSDLLKRVFSQQD